MTIHAATDRSDRLQRVLAFLASRKYPPSSLEILAGARVCGLESIRELRARGYEIECRESSEDGRRIWRYALLTPYTPPGREKFPDAVGLDGERLRAWQRQAAADRRIRCEWCGGQVLRSKPNRRFCCRRCKDAAYAVTHPTRPHRRAHV